MSSKKIAVVTGGNKGVGLGIVRALCRKFDGSVILTARDVGRGQAAVSELQKEGLSPLFHQLDIDSVPSAEKLRDHLVEKYGGLDVLVNNAGIAYKQASTASFLEQAEVTNRTNYFGTLNTSNVLFPILKPHARVVHVSSKSSTMCLSRCSDDLVNRWMSTSTVDQCTSLINQFIEDVRAGDYKKKGWPQTAYGVSKLGITCLTPIQQAQLDKESREDIIVNACCPGYVKTDMTSHKGPLTIDQGADTPVYLALLPPNTGSPRGEFVSKRDIINVHPKYGQVKATL